MDDWDLWTEELEPYEPPLIDRRRRTFRIVAAVVVIAMILTLVIPAIVRITRNEPEPDRGTVTAQAVPDHPTGWATTPQRA